MRKLNSVTSTLAALMIASVLSGCGGDSGEPASAPVGSDVWTPSDSAAATAAAADDAAARDFNPGGLVGKEIKPGTYFVTDADGCYWERTNRNGATIDNYFTNGARRVQVTIRSSDYSFNSERCGEWHPAG